MSRLIKFQIVVVLLVFALAACAPTVIVSELWHQANGSCRDSGSDVSGGHCNTHYGSS